MTKHQLMFVAVKFAGFSTLVFGVTLLLSSLVSLALDYTLPSPHRAAFTVQSLPWTAFIHIIIALLIVRRAEKITTWLLGREIT